MPLIHSIARGTMTLCCAWPLLFLQLQPAIEQARKAGEEALPPLNLADGEPLVLPGVVIEEIPEDSALKRAGLQPGDVILSWERLPNPPANPEGASGTIDSPFDWMWLEIEQAPRGVIRLRGEQGKNEKMWEVGAGAWEGEILPRFQGALSTWAQQALLLEKGATNSDATIRWKDLGSRVGGRGDRNLAAWLSIRAAASAKEKLPQTALQFYSSALEWSLTDRANFLILDLQGKLLYQGQDFVHAEKSFRDSLEVARTIEMSKLCIAHAESHLATPLWYQGKKQEAEALLNDAFQTYSLLAPQSLELAKILRNLGIRADEKGDSSAALLYFSRAVELTSTLQPDGLYHAANLHELGSDEKDAGKTREARVHLEEALRIRKKLAPGSLELANTMNVLGLLFDNTGDLEEARSHFQDGLEIAMSATHNELYVASLLNSLSITASELGQWGAAEHFSRRAVTLVTNDNRNSGMLAVILTNLAISVENQGRLAEALRHYLRSLKIKKRNRAAPYSLAATFRNLGVLYYRMGKVKEAEKYMQQALRIGKVHYPESLETAGTLGQLGVLRGEAGDIEGSLSALSRAVGIVAKVSPQSPEAARIFSNYGVALQRHGDNETANIYYQRALLVQDSLFYRASASPESRATFFAAGQEPYFNTIDYLLLNNKPEEALELTERWRGRSLYSQLLERNLTGAELLPEKDRARLAVAERSLDALAAVAVEGRTEAKAGEGASTVDQLLLALWQRDGFLAERRRRALATEPLELQRLDVPDAALSALDQGTEALTYVTGPQQVHLFFGKEGQPPRVQSLSITEQALRQRVERFRELIPLARPGSQIGELRLVEFRHLGKQLYDILLKPAEAEIEKAERVMIVADGPLHYLPFAALTRETMGEDGVKRDQYLAEWKPFHSVLSASVFAELKKDRRDPTKPSNGPALEFVGFGDPLFPVSVTLKDPDRITDIRVRSAARRGGLELVPLPNTRREIEGIAALFPPGRVQTFLGAEATEEKAKAIGKGARILHFATHARLDDRFPLNSSLLLSMPEGFPEDRENGILQVWEIFEGVRLDADLVVLSACDSGLGEEQGGEGLIGLTRAFQYAGARTVIASLWEVRDEATAELMIRFYRHLTSGMPKDQALQAAQRELLAGPIEIPGADGQAIRFDATAPYYWAAFQVIGDWK